MSHKNLQVGIERRVTGGVAAVACCALRFNREEQSKRDEQTDDCSDETDRYEIHLHFSDNLCSQIMFFVFRCGFLFFFIFHHLSLSVLFFLFFAESEIEQANSMN